MELPLPRLTDAELVIGLVGRMGVDLDAVSDAIEDALRVFDYDVSLIKVSQHPSDFVDLNLPKADAGAPFHERIKSKISACNFLRKKAQRNDILAFTSVLEIRKIRNLDKHASVGFVKRRVFLIHQLKRVEEVLLLRQIYGSQFIQISCHAELEDRLRILQQRIRHDSLHMEAEAEKIANDLVEQDNNEANVPTGQRVQDTFPLADLVIDTTDFSTAQENITRFFRALFGDFTISPTHHEYGMNLAYSAGLRSVDLSRQVGAAIMRRSGEVVSLGCNEVPKFGGGTYWEDDQPDFRDIRLKEDINSTKRMGLAFDIVKILKKAKFLDEKLNRLNDDELKRELFEKKDATLASSKVLGILEFGRGLHGEMNAITDAARLGLSVKDAVLYTTTFPCHNCAKHIVGAGITEVHYLIPYPKSEVGILYKDSIHIGIGKKKEKKVPFVQFSGITPRRYRSFFEKEKLKDDFGILKKWRPATASPLVETALPSYIDTETWALGTMLQELPADVRKYME